MNKIIKKIASNDNSSAFKKFAKLHDLIYLGESSDHEEPIKGVLLNDKRIDRNSVQGVSSAHDINLVQRIMPSRLHNDKYKWTILQVTTEATLPHVFIDGHKHQQDIYSSLFSAFGHYRQLDQFVSQNLTHFSAHFTTFGAVEESAFIHNVLTKEVLELIYGHGANLDYELDSHHLRVYNLTEDITVEQIEDMFMLAQNLVHTIETQAENFS